MTTHTLRPTFLLLIVVALPPILAFIHQGGVVGNEPRAVDFVKDVQPILQARCASCHGPEKQRSGFRIDRKDAALKGGDSGPAIVPGKSADSPLVHRISSSEKNERMPPTGDRLTAEQIALLRAWIDQGASWPEAASAPDPRKNHWAFQPVKRPSLPVVKTKDWARNPIDDFILARLEKQGLLPSLDADRATLIRRLKFDLLGLPPTPEEVAAFAADASPDAYERLVDRYLASPQYGERWARHWLDVVRFAESHGFEMNQPRPNAWPYRDYVIRAFNEDRPYDRFITEQLAGDGVGVDEATGFLVAGPWDQVKSPDLALTLQQRADELHDMVSTTGSAFLGLTVGCARCHNHKFDPVAQTDYYGFKAVFAGVQHGERSLQFADTEQRRKEMEAAQQELARLSAELDALEPIAQPDGPAGRRLPVSALRNTERFVPIRVRFVRFTILATNNIEPCIDELEVYTSGPSPQNIALASAGARATSSGNFRNGGTIHKLEHVNDGRHGNGRSWISNSVGSGWVQIELKEPAVIDRIIWGRDREGRYNDRLATRYRIEVALELDAWKTVASSEDRLPFGRPAPSAPPALTETERESFQQLVKRRTALESSGAARDSPPMIYAGKFAAPESTHRLHRGDPMQKREPVPPAVLSEFGARMPIAVDASDQERRRALAKWITDPQNPLTARVLVNRLWQYHFGAGIVSTPSDFGLNGARPSHPELLDWLASELTSGGWSMKHVHRLILLSSTYRQSSKPKPDGLAADASARLLWRYPPRRLEAEPLRDAVLFVSGNLDPRMGGPGFDLFEPNSNYVKVYNSKKEFGPPEWRRMVYQAKPRMQLDDTFGAFDCPDAGQITPKRLSSTTPLQALNLLNSPFLMQQAKRFAERIEKEVGPAPQAQVKRGFMLAFQREPADEEVTVAVELIREHGLAAFCRALFNANEFVFVF